MNETLHINCWRDLEPLGINMLSGESCAFAMRLLCDVNETGRDLIVDYLGLPYDALLARPWNSRVNDQPSVGSILLHRDSLLQLAAFALTRDGAMAIVNTNIGIIGLYTQELIERYTEMLAAWPETHAKWTLNRNYRVLGHPHEGSRNVHAMTGRSQ